MTIGQRIAELRKKNNLSQEALGEELGVSRQSVSKWESDAALPEIDKLVAMSKRFGVTVGFLLGVEEEAARQAERAPEQSGPTEAEVLQRYLDSLPKKKPLSKKWRVVCAVALSIFLFLAIDYIDNLESRINSLNSTINNMSNQMANVQSELYGISNDITTQIEEALKQEYGLLASWDLELTELDYAAGNARVELSAVLKNKVDSVDELSFYARLSDGSYVTCDTGTWDPMSSSYTAAVTLPLSEYDLVYYLSTPEGTVCLSADYYYDGLSNLQESTGLQLSWADFYGSWGSDGIDGQFELYFAPPWMCVKGETLELGTPEVTVKLMYNGKVMAELVPEAQQRGVEWMYQCSFAVKNSAMRKPPEAGDQVWIEYSIAFENGPSASGYANMSFVYDGTRWVENEEALS